MNYFTTLETYLYKAKFKTDQEASVYFGVSMPTLRKLIIEEDYDSIGIRIGNAIVNGLNKRIGNGSKLNLEDVFPKIVFRENKKGYYEKRGFKKYWTDEEVKILKTNINKLSRYQLSVLLNKTESQVRGYCYYYKIKKKNIKNKIDGIYKSKKAKASAIVNNEIRKRNLKQEPCELCKNKNTDAHHNDYDKPLEVSWLCRKCHIYIHKLLKTKKQ